MVDNDIKVLEGLIDELTLGIQHELIGDQDIAMGLTYYGDYIGSGDNIMPSEIVVKVLGRQTLIDFNPPHFKKVC